MKHLIVSFILLVSFFCVKQVIAQKVWYENTILWTAPGDDGNTGIASLYDMRYSTDSLTLINNWNACTPCVLIPNMPVPDSAGSPQSFFFGDSLMTGTTYYFAIKTADEVPNWSGISSILVIYVPDIIPPAVIIDLRWIQ